MSHADSSGTDATNRSADSVGPVARAPSGSRWRRRLVWLTCAAIVVGVCSFLRFSEGQRGANAQSERAAATSAGESALPRVERPQHDVMALVNGQDISRRDLIDACIRGHGKDVLESLVNKKLITGHCERRGIKITDEEIAAEVDRMAGRFKLGREQWLEMLEKERGIGPQEYARDIVWPTLALRKLAAADLEVSPEELQKAFEQQYGEMVRARLIAVSSAELAQQLHAQLTAQPERFPRLAIEHSIDVNSASVGGLIQPIRRHVGDPNIEREVFGLAEGQISSILQVAGQFVILKSEGRIPAREVQRDQVEQQIVEKIKDEKLREVAQTLFKQLQSVATIQNVFNDPQLSKTMPGVVATVNGDRITLKELGQESLLRHGEEVLESEISHLLLRQELARAGLTVQQADLDAEMLHAAELAGVLDSQDTMDLNQWIEKIAAEQKISRAQYINDAVWPSAALKKLTAGKVAVTEEDLNRGFEANYGARVRCRAIVLGNMRRAQEVWDKARQNPSVEFFGDLAEQYSIEPTSKSLRGEVPPLQRYGGQPQLEEVAYQLQPGELSGIVQLGDKFIILLCEGQTERYDIDQTDVQDILYRDIYEKKIRLAMNRKFVAIREQARVDNYLAGTSQAPVQHSADSSSDVRRDASVQPASGP